MDTSQMTSMSHMFASDPKLTSITVDPTLFNTSKVTDMSRMFWGDGALVDIDLTPFDTSSVTNFYGMFESLGAIKSLDVSGFDTSQATNMQQMFYGTSSLENLDVSNFDTSKVTNMNSMFEDAGNRNAKLVLNVSDFDVAQVTDFGSMFFGAGIQILNVKYWQMSPDANTSSWLGQMDNLWQLTVGQHVKLTDAKLPDVPEAGTPIPPHTSDQLGNPNLVSGIEQDGQFVTGWEMISSGTITDPEGPVWSTTQLMDLYKGNGIGAPMTYVWSQPVLNFYQPIDVATGQMVPDSEKVILDTYGALVDVNLDDLAVNGVIPDGYHAATGTELGSYKQQEKGLASRRMGLGLRFTWRRMPYRSLRVK
ncbi:BspA family leucine-rich repeat surface protein [Secundilactobacillus similis]|uniref:BspA family leucine-rich repeat surface protein n=1 Tax=Secundilactobacillus similis TaxID=414682 RepID=UPI0034E257D2